MVQLIDFKVIYICPAHNAKYIERKEYMDRMLRGLGFKNIIHYTSSSEAYPKCLVNATIDIFKQNLDEPFLLLEDDVEWTGISSFDLPAEADALYLGLSKSGGSATHNINEGSSKFEAYSTTQVRVINMLATHAILYVSRRYKEAVIAILEANSDSKYYNDVLISRIQKDYIILANKHPCFYQSAGFGNHPAVQDATMFVIS
jgi:hypothetical protein